jgi:hypothetical protein
VIPSHTHTHSLTDKIDFSSARTLYAKNAAF